MKYEPETPFDSIESAQEYIRLLSAAVLEAQEGVKADLTIVAGSDPKRIQALQLVCLNLEKLAQHTKSCGRILNDLRSLRRLLLQERRAHSRPMATRSEVGSAVVPAE